jgi:signal transduction histidine kinase/ActR/RegA family two-component response regulator
MRQLHSKLTAITEVRRLNRYAILLATGWTILIVASLAKTWERLEEHSRALAREEARSRFQTDMAYRRWVMVLGGVYVPVTPGTPPSPYLAHVPDRDIQTPSGQRLTLVNSSYMSRQVAELNEQRPGPRHHITSLQPLRPENAADAWETASLKAFEDGQEEATTIEWHDHEPYLRLMRPLITDASCLKCHAAQGYQVGDVRGGISVTVPLEPFQALTSAELSRAGLIHGLLWFVGGLGLGLGRRQLRRDILEREEATRQRAALQEQLHQAQKMEAVGQLASGVAHDFNNLLTVILLNVDLLENRLPGSPVATEATATVRSAAEQAVGLTRSLLIFSRRLPAEKKLVKLQDIVATTTRMLRRLLPASIEMSIDAPTGRPLWIEADPTQLQQVILNLAINARDAMPEGGKLHIRLQPGVAEEDLPDQAAHPGRAWVYLEVSDTGTGIPDETLPRLFEPFFSTKPQGQGTGLGLAIVRGIVESHQGQVRVQSLLGQGATFTVRLPCAPPPAMELTEDDSVRLARGHGETILLAEDDQFVRESISTLLHTLGYNVLSAPDGRVATAQWQANSERIRAAILDVDLPGRSGIECLQLMRAEGRVAPAILISGRTEWSPHVLSNAPVEVLRKPFMARDLAELLRRLLSPGPTREKAAPTHVGPTNG